jgi:hypothetical protein
MLSRFKQSGKNLNQCLIETNNQHRIERDENIQACFKKHKAFIGSDACYAQIKKIKAADQSVILKENLKYICFYEASIFQNMNTCMVRAAEFADGEIHDEAIFDCYKQFQDKMNKRLCIQTSAKLIYPAKKAHLLQHCYNTYN